METIKAIHGRRSVRKFSPEPISRDIIERIISAGMQAPSSKNRQPWRFVVVEGGARAAMLDVIDNGIAREISDPRLPESAKFAAAAKHTFTIMAGAPVTIFIINPLNRMEDYPANLDARFFETGNVQSVGACIQNMLLAATDLGIGSLWICDIYFTYGELAKWLGTDEQIVAAVSFGVPAEDPPARPRNSIDSLVEWRA